MLDDELNVAGDGDARWDLHAAVKHLQESAELGVLDRRERTVVPCAPEGEIVPHARCGVSRARGERGDGFALRRLGRLAFEDVAPQVSG